MTTGYVMTPIAAVNGPLWVTFGVIVAVTLVISWFASKRVNTATDFWAAGRGLTGPQNGFAIAGDYMSAASFLGIAGLIYLFGFDGFMYSVGFLVAFLTVLFLLAERMRNAASTRSPTCCRTGSSRSRPGAAAALGTLTVVAFYLIAQMVGAGVLIEGLVEIDFSLAVLLTGAFMVSYIVLGGMLATSWVQIIKAFLLITAAVVMTIWVLAKVSWNPIDLFTEAEGKSAEGEAYLKPGLFLSSPLDTVSLGLGLVLGTGRPAAHPDAVLHRPERQGRPLVGDVGDGADRRFLHHDHGARLRRAGDPRSGGEEAAGATGNGAVLLLADKLGGEFFQAIIAGVAFATILAVVAGLVISASGAVAHDVWSNIVRRGQDRERGGLGREDRGARDRGRSRSASPSSAARA